MEAPAVLNRSERAAGATDCISELFHHERRRDEAYWANYRVEQRLRALRDTLDPPEPPLFLRRHAITDMPPDPSLRHIFKVFFGMGA